MPILSDLFINGEWNVGTGRLAVHDPSDDSVITEVATSDEALCFKEIGRAHV